MTELGPAQPQLVLNAFLSKECSNMLVGKCHTCEEVTAMKDDSMRAVMHQLKQSIEEWDTNKCPVTK